MPRQLTPEEIKIIRQTEEEGSRLDERMQPGKPNSGNRMVQIVKGTLIFIIVFAAFACIAYAIVNGTAR